MAAILLPPETTDRIIDLLPYEDRSSGLSVCGLVCTSWIPRVRYHRFAHVELRPSRFADFHALLSTSASIAPYVTSLVVQAEPPGWGLKGIRPCLDLSSLTNVRRLDLNYWKLDVFPEDASLLFGCMPRSVEELHVDQMALGTGSDLLLLWYSFPRLRSFTVYGTPVVKVDHGPVPDDFSPSKWKPEPLDAANREWIDISRDRLCFSPSITLSELDLRCRSVHRLHKVVAWLCARRIFGQLRSFSIRMFALAKDGPVVQKILRALGPSLDRLELNMVVLNNPEALASEWRKRFMEETMLYQSECTHRLHLGLYQCDLAQCSHLRELHLTASLDPSKPLWASAFLRQLRTPSIEVVLLTIEEGVNYTVPARASLSELVIALCGGMFGQLQKVTVRIAADLEGKAREETMTFIRKEFARLKERGLLIIEEVAQWYSLC